MTHPYRELIDQEAHRAETDLEAFRSRSLTIVTTSSGIVTLLIGVVALVVGRTGEDRETSAAAMVAFAVSLALFIFAAVLALTANLAAGIQRPSDRELARITTEQGWSEHDQAEQEREVAEVLVTYVVTVRKLGAAAARRLNRAILLQIIGLTVSALASVLTMLEYRS